MEIYIGIYFIYLFIKRFIGIKKEEKSKLFIARKLI